MLVLKTWIGSNAAAILKNTGWTQKTAASWTKLQRNPQNSHLSNICYPRLLCVLWATPSSPSLTAFRPNLDNPISTTSQNFWVCPNHIFPLALLLLLHDFAGHGESEEHTCCITTALAVISPCPTLTLPQSSIKYYALPMLDFFFPLLNQCYPKQLCDEGNIDFVVSNMVATGHKPLLSTWKVNNATEKLNF